MSRSAQYGSPDALGKQQERKELPSRQISNEPKETASTLSQSINKLFEYCQSEAMEYWASISGLQNDLSQAYKLTIETSLSFQENVINKLPFFPSPEFLGLKNVNDFEEACLRTNQMQYQAMLAIIEVSEQNLKLMSESTKPFQEITKSVVFPWPYWKVR